MFLRIFRSFVFIGALFGGIAQAAPDQKIIDLLSDNANAGCLVGNEGSFSAKASGEVSLLKRGGSGNIEIRDITAPGAAGFLDEKIKAAFGEKIQQCLQPYRLKIQDYILANAGKPKETLVIRGDQGSSHAGDDPADGNDSTSCVRADVQHGWSLVPNSGVTVVDEIANGSLGVTGTTYNADTFCSTFHIVRANRGRSAGVAAHVEATQTRPGS